MLAKPSRGLNVFVSYSRKDSGLLDQFVSVIEACGHTIVRDTSDLVAGELWEAQLYELLNRADAVLLLVSPDWLQSKSCAWEFETARCLHKHCLPVRINDAEEEISTEMASIQCIQFENKNFGKGLAQIIQALSIENDWLRQHTVLSHFAEKWSTGNRSKSLLLDKPTLHEATAWLNAKPYFLPGPTAILSDFIDASKLRHKGWW